MGTIRRRSGQGNPGSPAGMRRATGALAALALATGAAVAQPAPSFPGGAQSVSEAFQDWQVACTLPQGTKRCVISQQQLDSRSRQRVLSVELQPKGEKVEGVLFLPFGLFLEKGVALKLGEADLAALRFSTCLPQGCVVPLSFDARALAQLRKADALRVNAATDTGQVQPFTISLKGFGPALDRATALLK